MAFERISFSELWDWDENPILEGYYVGKKDDVGENHSSIYQIEVDSGEIVEFWDSTVLNSQFAMIRLGTRVKIEYKGLVDSPNRKGKQYKNFEVMQDKELMKDGF